MHSGIWCVSLPFTQELNLGDCGLPGVESSKEPIANRDNALRAEPQIFICTSVSVYIHTCASPPRYRNTGTLSLSFFHPTFFFSPELSYTWSALTPICHQTPSFHPKASFGSVCFGIRISLRVEFLIAIRLKAFSFLLALLSFSLFEPPIYFCLCGQPTFLQISAFLTP